VSDDLLAASFHTRPTVRLASSGISLTGPGIRLPAWGWAWLSDQ
jgi:hypothetical protein